MMMMMMMMMMVVVVCKKFSTYLSENTCRVPYKNPVMFNPLKPSGNLTYNGV
jgi:hypothetical protein